MLPRIGTKSLRSLAKMGVIVVITRDAVAWDTPNISPKKA